MVSQATSLTIAAVLLVPVGMALALFLMGVQEVLQRLAPHDKRGRVMSLYTLLGTGSAPLAALIALPLVEAFGSRAPLFAAGVIGVLGSLAMLTLVTRALVRQKRIEPVSPRTGDPQPLAPSVSKPTDERMGVPFVDLWIRVSAELAVGNNVNGAAVAELVQMGMAARMGQKLQQVRPADLDHLPIGVLAELIGYRSFVERKIHRVIDDYVSLREVLQFSSSFQAAALHLAVRALPDPAPSGEMRYGRTVWPVVVRVEDATQVELEPWQHAVLEDVLDEILATRTGSPTSGRPVTVDRRYAALDSVPGLVGAFERRARAPGGPRIALVAVLSMDRHGVRTLHLDPARRVGPVLRERLLQMIHLRGPLPEAAAAELRQLLSPNRASRQDFMKARQLLSTVERFLLTARARARIEPDLAVGIFADAAALLDELTAMPLWHSPVEWQLNYDVEQARDRLTRLRYMISKLRRQYPTDRIALAQALRDTTALVSEYMVERNPDDDRGWPLKDIPGWLGTDLDDLRDVLLVVPLLVQGIDKVAVSGR